MLLCVHPDWQPYVCETLLLEGIPGGCSKHMLVHVSSWVALHIVPFCVENTVPTSYKKEDMQALSHLCPKSYDWSQGRVCLSRFDVVVWFKKALSGCSSHVLIPPGVEARG